MSYLLKPYIKFHKYWQGTVCKKCKNNNLINGFYEMYNGDWEFICKECFEHEKFTVKDILKYFPDHHNITIENFEYNLETFPCIQYYGELTVKEIYQNGSELIIKVFEKPMMWN